MSNKNERIRIPHKRGDLDRFDNEFVVKEECNKLVLKVVDELCTKYDIIDLKQYVIEEIASSFTERIIRDMYEHIIEEKESSKKENNNEY